MYPSLPEGTNLKLSIDYTYEAVILLDQKWSHFLWFNIIRKHTQDMGPHSFTAGHHMAIHRILLLHTKRKPSELFGRLVHSVWKEHGHSKLSSQTQRTETVRQVLCAIFWTDSFTKQMLLLACQDTPGRAQQGHISHGSYKQVTLVSNLACVTAKLVELCPSASVKRTTEQSLLLGLLEQI